jgi:ABC-type amino acid transport substrate-binding protein
MRHRLKGVLLGGCIFWVSVTATLLLISTVFAAAEISVDDARPSVTFVCEARPDQPNYKAALVYLTDVFNHLGYRYSQQHVDTVEAIRRLRTGEADGDCARLDGFVEAAGLDEFVAIGPAYSHASFSSWFLQRPKIARARQRVGYNSNAILLKKHLLDMGYRQLFPIVEKDDFTRLLLNGKLDIVVNYKKSMSFISHKRYQKIYSSDSFLTLPVKPYIHKALAKKLEKRWEVAVQDFFDDHKNLSGSVKIPEKTQGSVTFSCSLHTGTILFRHFETTYRDLFHQLGYKFELISMPRSREAHELSAGNVDGICGRTIYHESHQPNAIRVKQPIILTNLRVWSRMPYRDVNSVDDLPQFSSLAMVRGTTYLNEKLKDHKGNIVKTLNMAAAVKMLAAGRVDYVLGLEISFQEFIGESTIQAPIYGVGTLDSLNIYPYLHHSRNEIAQQLEPLLLQRAAEAIE